MVNDLSWKSFSEYYRLQNDRYVKDVELLQRLQSEEHYPIILYPESLNHQISKDFKIGLPDEKKCEGKYIYIHDYLNAAKKFNIKGDDWQFLARPVNPAHLSYPRMHSVPTEKKESYNSYNIGCLIPIVIMALLCTLPAFFIDPDAPELGIIIGILWIPAVFVMAYQFGVGKVETKTRIVKLSDAEVENEKMKTRAQYKKDVEEYERLKAICEKNWSNYNIKVETQSAILDRYARLIAAYFFKRSLLNPVNLQRHTNPPKRGFSEDILFYHLMKELPEYTKMDICAGVYSPDITLSLKRYSPIDIEIDEPYEFVSKKEIHYVGCGDETRNRFFTVNNWFVIRFSENQIKCHLEECIFLIKAFMEFIKTGNTRLLYEADTIVKRIKEPRWTKEMSRMWAIEDRRNY